MTEVHGDDKASPTTGTAAMTSAMRASDLFEVVIAVIAAGTVISAIFLILYRVTRGNPETARLAALKKEFSSDDVNKPG